MNEKVKCLKCKRDFNKITHTHLRKAHDMSFVDYEKEFGKGILNHGYKWKSSIEPDRPRQDIPKHLLEKSPATLLLEADPMLWGQMFFPHHFKKNSPRFHYALIHAARKHKNLAVAAPRKSAKSTYLSFLKPFHKIAFQQEPFIVLISNTFKKAAEYLNTIKMEITDNHKFKEAMRMNPITFKRDAEGDTIFEHKNGFKTRFLCKGVDQIGSLRGEKFGADRPGLILFDDVEDDELVRSPERRLKLKNEFDEVISRLGHDKTQIIIVGTILHDDSQLAKILRPDEYLEFHKIIYKAHLNPGTPEETSLWPEEWSVDYLKQLMIDKPNVYAKEMQNDPVAGTNTKFRASDFRYWKQEDGRIFLLDEEGNVESSYDFSECKAAIACDLAWKEKRNSDSSVIMPGLLTPNSEILVCEYICKKGMKPDETAEHLFQLVERYENLTKNTVPVGFEKAMLENVTQWLLKREMKKQNKFIMTKELVWDGDKEQRVLTRLQPRYSQHVIYHKKGMGELEHELERFPSGVHDDLPDALQGLVQLLQYPKAKKENPVGDDMFAKVRRFHIEAKYDRPSFKKTGSRQESARWWNKVPAKKALW